MIEHEPFLDERRNKLFSALRKQMHAQEEREYAEREKTNPHPTEVELRLGTFIEGVEPQAREAVIAFIQKGYQTLGSGFDSKRYDIQNIYGPLDLTNEERHKLESAGAAISDAYGMRETTISIKTPNPNEEEIVSLWRKITDALPTRIPIQDEAWLWNPIFLERYAPTRIDLQIIGWKQTIERLQQEQTWYLQHADQYRGPLQDIQKRLQSAREKLHALEEM